jgi:hypothetical protein
VLSAEAPDVVDALLARGVMRADVAVAGRGADPDAAERAAKRLAAEGWTWEQLVENYLADVKDRRARDTWLSYRTALNLADLKSLRGKLLSLIEANDIRLVRDAILDRGAERMSRAVTQQIKSALAWAVEQQHRGSGLPPRTTCSPSWPSIRINEQSCIRPTRWSASTARSSAGSTSSASSPTTPPSLVWSVPSSSSGTTNGPSSADTSRRIPSRRSAMTTASASPRSLTGPTRRRARKACRNGGGEPLLVLDQQESHEKVNSPARAQSQRSS